MRRAGHFRPDYNQRRQNSSTDNQFRVYEFDVKNRLKPGENSITVVFDSTYPYIDRQMKKRALASGVCVPWEKKGRGYVRKSPCNYGWDWGPALATCGIWRNIGLVAFNTGRINNMHIRQKHLSAGEAVDLDVILQADLAGKARVAALVTVELKGAVIDEKQVFFKNGKASARLRVDKPELVAHGMGAQPLYDVSVRLMKKDLF